VELLLAESYVRRDRVALVAFRRAAAELVLPPTRSLARARRLLAGLPGGGGTPLASAADAALALAETARRGGSAPVLVFLTDARANVARDGSGGRARAEADALAAARAVRAAGVAALLVDTAPRPGPFAARFAAEMGARYLPLPPPAPARWAPPYGAPRPPSRRCDVSDASAARLPAAASVAVPATPAVEVRASPRAAVALDLAQAFGMTLAFWWLATGW
jgi:hypothetical protein